MRHAGGIVLNILTVLSLLLCVATAAFWVRGTKGKDQGLYQLGKGYLIVFESHHGSVTLGVYPSNDPRGWVGMWTVFPDYAPIKLLDRWVGEFDFHIRGDAAREIPPGVQVPDWSLVTATLGFPLGRLVLCCRRGGRRRQGHCPSCSYDLAANVSGICPECGTAISKKISPSGGNP